MGELCPVFNTNRMVHEYVVEGYGPADERRGRLEEDDFRRAREISRWKRAVRKGWGRVRIARVEVDLPGEATIGKTFEVRAWIAGARARGRGPGRRSTSAGCTRVARSWIRRSSRWSTGGPADGDELLFEATISCRTSGTHGLTVRVLPHHPDLGHPHETGLIVWAS